MHMLRMGTHAFLLSSCSPMCDGPNSHDGDRKDVLSSRPDALGPPHRQALARPQNWRRTTAQTPVVRDMCLRWPKKRIERDFGMPLPNAARVRPFRALAPWRAPGQEMHGCQMHRGARQFTATAAGAAGWRATCPKPCVRRMARPKEKGPRHAICATHALSRRAPAPEKVHPSVARPLKNARHPTEPTHLRRIEVRAQGNARSPDAGAPKATRAYCLMTKPYALPLWDAGVHEHRASSEADLAGIAYMVRAHGPGAALLAVEHGAKDAQLWVRLGGFGL